jgi:metallo-beta-lactamase family protein
MNITFWGAAQTVTGSMHLCNIGGKGYLLDCGQFQGRRRESAELNKTLPFAAADVAAVLLSHAHIDHSGSLPLLVKSGFSGPIYATPATVDLCHAMLADSATIQERDAAFLNKRQARRRSIGAAGDSADGEIEPAYTLEDAERTYPLFRKVSIHEPVQVAPGVRYESFEAGHILGSTFMLLEAQENGARARIVFSGDLGRPGLPIIRDPEFPPAADYLILESTYGDRLHQPVRSVANRLASLVNRTYQRGGKLIVPAFAVGRTQQLVLLLHELMESHAIPAFPIYVDSPLALNVTDVFRKHEELFDQEARQFLRDGGEPFGFKRLTYVRSVEESKALNDLRGPYVVIASSGMCEAGRILHHLQHNIEDSRNTILLTGYQARNTLGRKIEEKRPEVPVFGDLLRLRAEVEKLDELSGHADQHDLLEWIAPIAGKLRKIFLVHGEPDQQGTLKELIEKRFQVSVVAPERGQTFEL